MIIDGNAPADLTGLNRRDIRDIERSMVKEREKIMMELPDDIDIEPLMQAIYKALVYCKKLNKEKYTPKKYRK
ncbi:hypothetical protein FYJ45_27470 [Eisenbergiella tayi]|uniref:Uncharacterized protein n=1 Tax=Eisenbergiella porci TaxID=2652274 RepID=A0A6N7WMQ2_9FIRM|nr:hypothetical protein [Eisenbergiella porci]MSS91817.1 hypothetical protein [Eisenbergiella porci]